jgi:hypothetical protein
MSSLSVRDIQGIAAFGNEVRIPTGSSLNVIGSATVGTLNSSDYRATSIKHTNGTNAINIYSNGMVGYPNIPAFHAWRSGGASDTVVGIFTDRFTSTFLNNGNHYNTGNGRFTCPVSGIYRFEMMLLARVGASNLETTFYRNGANISPRSFGYTYVTGGSDHDSLYISMYFFCNQNDFIQCGVTACGPGTNYYFGENLAYFSGCLVG